MERQCSDKYAKEGLDLTRPIRGQTSELSQGNPPYKTEVSTLSNSLARERNSSHHDKGLQCLCVLCQLVFFFFINLQKNIKKYMTSYIFLI